MLKIILASFFFSSVLWGAETNGVIVTNIVTAVPNFREVGGKLYNVDKSKLFQDISGTITAPRGDAVAIATIDERESSMHAVSLGLPAYQHAWHGQEIVLLHYPTEKATVGEKVFLARAIRVGDTNLPHGNYELWDYGTPHLVQVVTTNSITK